MLADELAARLLESPEHLVDEATGEVRDHPARYFAATLALEAMADNLVVTTLRHNEDEYEQGMALQHFSHRLSPAGSESLRRRSCRRATGGVDRAWDQLTPQDQWASKQRHNYSYRWVHAVFTMFHAPGSLTFPEVQRILKAFDKFRKRQCWTGAVFGGVKGVEDHITWRGSHVHIHCLLLMRRVDNDAWNAEWSDCLAGDPGAGFVKLMTIRKRVKDATSEETMSQALAEVTKYITKTGDLLEADPETGRRVPWEALAGLAAVQRWPRMFELLGAARAPKDEGSLDGRSPASLRSIRPEYSTAGPELVEGWNVEDDGPEPGRWDFFGREVIEAPPRGPSWRELMAQLPLDEWLEVMAARAVRARAWRLKQIRSRAVGPIVGIDGVERV